jgi:pimeloyl-ACP methyl ester carboxylesterase
LREFARGRPSWIDHVVDVGARRLLAVARAGEVDEIVVVGRSAGGVAALALMARTLEREPNLGHRGSKLVLLTLGSVMPADALDPAAERLRNLLKLAAAFGSDGTFMGHPAADVDAGGSN